MRVFFVALLLFVGLFGCGKDDDSDASDQATYRSMLVQDAAGLPVCDAAAEGWIAYVKSESKLKACSAGAWVDAPLAIDQSSMVAEQWTCGESDDLSEGDDSGISRVAIGMWVTEFSTGDYLASCSFAAITSGDVDTESYTVVAKAGSNALSCGGKLAYITAEFNVETGKVKYTDSDNKSRSQEVACTKS